VAENGLHKVSVCLRNENSMYGTPAEIGIDNFEFCSR